MFSRRAFGTLAVSAGLLVALTLPAQAASTLVDEETVSLRNGKSGGVLRYADRSGSQASNSVTMWADDTDGRSDRCTETWIDYSTSPHEHFNPGVLVNCSGRSGSVSGALSNNSKNVKGMGVIVCDVPNTPASPITRSRKNCRGDLGTMSLHSRQRYDSFGVTASKSPSGVIIYKI